MIRPTFAWLLCGSVLAASPVYSADELPWATKSSEPEKVQVSEAKPVVPASGKLTLAEAIGKAIANSPRLKSSDASRQASLGERRQAGVLPNPELEVTAENIAGDNQYKGLKSAEVTYGASQLIEIGGKRSSRIAMAERGIEQSNYDYQATKLDVIRDVKQAFVEAVAAKEEVKLAEEQQKLAGEVLQTVTQRVNAAREPLIQKSKASVALSTSRIALNKARRDYDTAVQLLATLMGEKAGELDTTAFYTITEPPTSGEVKEMLAGNPDIARWNPTLAKSKAALELEQANSLPDPRLSAGIRDFRDSGDKAFVASVSIPFPVFNANRGNIAKAHAEVSKAVSDQRVAEQMLESELNRSLQAQRVAYTQATTLKTSILPEAEQAFSLSRKGYQEGKFPYLEVLDAERTLADARVQHIEALKEYHNQRAIIERLTGENHDQK